MAQLPPEQRKKVKKPLLWIGLAGIVMMFAGLTSGYVVSRSGLISDDQWLVFELPRQFLYATIAIVTGSVALIWGKKALKNGDPAQLQLAIAFMAGIAFAVLQYLGWQNLIDRGLFFTGPQSNTAISWVYAITGLHWVHVISGLIVLLVTLIRSLKKAYSKDNHLGYDLASIYWHFLDGLWIYLYCFLLFIR